MIFLKRLVNPKAQMEYEKTDVEQINDRLLIEKINSFYGRYKKQLAVLFLCMGLLLLMAMLHKQSVLEASMYQVDHQQSDWMSKQMADMHEQLNQLSVNVKDSPQAQTILTKLNETLADIEKNVADNAKSKEVEKLSQEMNQGFDTLAKSLSSQGQSAIYLEPKVLPFKVISVDVIAEQPFVSVDEDHHILPLGIGDSLSGWKLVSADYDQVEVVFENTEGKYVRVTALSQASDIK